MPDIGRTRVSRYSSPDAAKKAFLKVRSEREFQVFARATEVGKEFWERLELERQDKLEVVSWDDELKLHDRWAHQILGDAAPRKALEQLAMQFQDYLLLSKGEPIRRRVTVRLGDNEAVERTVDEGHLPNVLANKSMMMAYLWLFAAGYAGIRPYPKGTECALLSIATGLSEHLAGQRPGDVDAPKAHPGSRGGLDEDPIDFVKTWRRRVKDAFPRVALHVQGTIGDLYGPRPPLPRHRPLGVRETKRRKRAYRAKKRRTRARKLPAARRMGSVRLAA